MKTILMLTDFSDNATHAARSAATVVEKLHTDILLFNTYYDHPILPTYGGGPLVVEEFVFRKEDSTAQLSHLAIQLRHVIADQTKNGFRPKTDYQSGEGSLGGNVAVILKEKQIDMIVMGGSTNSGLEHLFFGSDTLDVIDHANCPVLVIPPKASLKKLNKVTLATAFELADINAITYLVSVAKNIGFELEIVHVSSSEEDSIKERAIHNHILAIKQANVTYHQIRGKDVVKRLKRMCKENGSDILALVHYQHGFFAGIFRKSNTEQALSGNHLPIMIIPSKLKESFS
jgi:nucleotide-binding universal stress UspA family protein